MFFFAIQAGKLVYVLKLDPHAMIGCSTMQMHIETTRWLNMLNCNK